jgi:hypothetical protein
MRTVAMLALLLLPTGAMADWYGTGPTPCTHYTEAQFQDKLQKTLDFVAITERMANTNHRQVNKVVRTSSSVKIVTIDSFHGTWTGYRWFTTQAECDSDFRAWMEEEDARRMKRVEEDIRRMRESAK